MERLGNPRCACLPRHSGSALDCSVVTRSSGPLHLGVATPHRAPYGSLWGGGVLTCGLGCACAVLEAADMVIILGFQEVWVCLGSEILDQRAF